AARCARGLPENSLPSDSRGRGEAGRLMHPQPRMRNDSKHTSVVTTVTPERPGIPRAMGLRLLRDLLGEPGLFATVVPEKLSPLKNLTPASGSQNNTT